MYFFFSIYFPYCYFFISRKSTQKDVVNDVRAESALEYAALIKPKRNVINTKMPNFSLFMTATNKSSPSATILFINAYSYKK